LKDIKGLYFYAFYDSFAYNFYMAHFTFNKAFPFILIQYFPYVVTTIIQPKREPRLNRDEERKKKKKA
jgi:hypothetical protein